MEPKNLAVQSALFIHVFGGLKIMLTCVQTLHTTHVHIHKLHSYVTNQDKKAVDRARSLNNIKLYIK